MDEHIIEALGKSKVIIRDGTVVSVEDPIVDYCPLFDKYRGIKKLTKESIKENIEFRIKDFGMCTENREFPSQDFLSIGASEIISTLLKKGLLDASVIVGDGCGTVILNDPEKVEVSGSNIRDYQDITFEKSHFICRIIKCFRPKYLRNKSNKRCQKAISKGYNKIAVTVSNAEEIKEIRKLEKEYSCDIFIIGVHTSGISKKKQVSLLKMGI